MCSAVDMGENNIRFERDTCKGHMPERGEVLQTFADAHLDLSVTSSFGAICTRVQKPLVLEIQELVLAIEFTDTLTLRPQFETTWMVTIN